MKKFTLLSATLALATTATSSWAASVGVNFTNEFAVGASSLNASASAGFVAQDDWNNVDVLTSSGSANALGNDSGVATSVNLSWSNVNNSFFGSSSTGTANDTLYSGIIEGNFSNINSGPNLTVTGVNFDSYDVYVYMAEFGSTGASVAVDGLTKFYTATNNFGAIGFVEATSTSAGSLSTATYARFSGLSGSSFNIDFNKVGSGNRAAVAGFQIVEISAVPLPASLPLFMIGIAAFGAFRRRTSVPG